MGRRAVQPLNQRAAAAADASVAPETGGRQLTSAPSDAQLRERWMDAYVANGGQVEDVADPTVVGRRADPAPPATAAVTPCPCADAEILSETVVDTDPSHLVENPFTATAANDIVLPRDRHRIGIGEEVRLTYSRGAAQWSIQGEGRWTAATQPYSSSIASGTTVTFVAGEVAGSITVEAVGDGCNKEIRFEVFAPDTLTLVQTSLLIHNEGHADCGAYVNKRVGPSDVCFVNVRFLERDALVSQAEGMWSPSMGTTHHPVGKPVTGSQLIKARGGTYFHVEDLCYGGTEGYDEQAFVNGMSGGFINNIPYLYGLLDGPISHRPPFSPVTQTVLTHNERSSTGHCSTTSQRGTQQSPGGAVLFSIDCEYTEPSSNVDEGGQPKSFENCTTPPP